MTNEEKQMLFKVLCDGLPYGVMAEARGWDEEKEEEVLVSVAVYSINTDGYVYFCDNAYDITYCRIEECRPYLRPMSSMTEKETIEWHETTFGQRWITFDNVERCVDWLNAHHFDYRSLIEKGLALEAPEGMYKND